MDIGHVLLERAEAREVAVANGASGASEMFVNMVPAGAFLTESPVALATKEHALFADHWTA